MALEPVPHHERTREVCDRLSHLASRMARPYLEQVSENRERAPINGFECLRQQRLNQPFRFLVFALTDPHMADHTLLVDEIHRRPVTVVIATPRREVVIDGDGKEGMAHVVGWQIGKKWPLHTSLRVIST